MTFLQFLHLLIFYFIFVSFLYLHCIYCCFYILASILSFSFRFQKTTSTLLADSPKDRVGKLVQSSSHLQIHYLPPSTFCCSSAPSSPGIVIIARIREIEIETTKELEREGKESHHIATAATPSSRHHQSVASKNRT